MIYLIIIEFIAGSLLHFLYDFIPNILTALIAPINESIFQHLKLLFFPVLIISLLYYKNKDDNYWYSLSISLLVGVLSIPLIYYFYHCGLGVDNLLVDIALLFVSITLTNLLQYHMIKYKVTNNRIISYSLIILIFGMLIIGTFYPPALPIFSY